MASIGGPGGIRTPDLLVRSFNRRFLPCFWFTHFTKRTAKNIYFWENVYRINRVKTIEIIELENKQRFKQRYRYQEINIFTADLTALSMAICKIVLLQLIPPAFKNLFSELQPAPADSQTT